VNSLFQDTPAVAKGLFEGLTASAADDVKALRIARLELDDAYLRRSTTGISACWLGQFTPQELAMLPTAFSVGGDGATTTSVRRPVAPARDQHTDQGDGAEYGVYSNTGGQASTRA